MFRKASSMNDAFFWMQIYLFVIIAIPAGLHFTLLYTGRTSFLKRKWALAALYIPVLAISTSLLFQNYMFSSIVKRPWGYAPVLASSSIPRNIAMLWMAVLNSCAIIIILHHLFKTHDKNEKKQAFLVAMGVIAPILLANISQFFFPIIGVETPELTTVGTTLQAAFIGFAIWRYDLFSINPVTAANNIVSTMSDVFILLNPRGKILAINQAVTDLLKYGEDDIIQKPVTTLLSGEATEYFEFAGAAIDGKPKPPVRTGKAPVKNLEGMLTTLGGRKIPTSVAVSTLWNRNGSIAGHVVIARDITKQKQIEAEREALINELQDALSNIKALRGLLPICANCKKIRNDEGYWQDVTVYIRNHSEADFSHGICPDCIEKLYPDLAHEVELKMSDNRQPARQGKSNERNEA